MVRSYVDPAVDYSVRKITRGVPTCDPICIVAREQTLLRTRVGSGLEPAVRQVPDFATAKVSQQSFH